MKSLPNILLTMADDQRHSALGCCDGPTADAVRTPHLDALAERGVCFSQAHHAGSTCPAVCSPSRAMLHTGCGPFDIPAGMVQHGLGPDYDGPPNAPTLGQLLERLGYVRHHVGKWHNDDDSFRRSYDTGDFLFRGGMSDQFNLPLQAYSGSEFHGQYCANAHATDIFTNAARGFLQSHAIGDNRDRPFFLVVAFTAPHDPRRTHASWHERYSADDIEPPPNALGEYPFNTGVLDIRDEWLTPHPREARQTAHEIADYYAMTEHLDHGIGRIHSALDDLGLGDNTLVVHTADHGLAVGQHGLMGKQNLHEHSTRVPLILAGPGIDAEQKRSVPVYQQDLFPTLLEFVGSQAPPRCAFKSLWPTIENASHRPYEGVGSMYMDGQRMWTDGCHKIIRYGLPDKQSVFQRFDLEDDPWEQSLDTISESDNPNDDLFNRLEDWQREAGDPALTASA